MAVTINWKICDNDKACGGIEVCPTGALYWNEAEGCIGTNNDICINCSKCVTDGCPVGAIIVTLTPEEYTQAQNEIANDSRDKTQLMVDRFGAIPVSDDVLIEKADIIEKTKTGITFIERFTDSSIQCLLHSIEVDNVRYRTHLDFAYYKCEDNEADETTEHPVLDIYVDGVLLGSVCGYYSDTQIDVFIEKIMDFLKN